MSKYSQIITKLFDTNSAFVRDDFYEFVWEIIKKYPSDTKKSKSIDQDGNEYVREEIAIFEDINSDKLAIMTYKMPSKTKVERARSEQRNLISTYLRNEWVFQGINSVLVAFYSDDSRDWRLSFIKQEFKLSQTELDSKWRPKIVNELTPAKRYSFLVESNSKNLTVKQRLNDLIQEKILISDIEKAFSVEKVSKEFFEKYVGLYDRLAKAFEKDEIFKKVEEENSNGDEHFRENFVKKLLGQIVFLYFLQKKWWLWVKKNEKWWDGDKNFLQNLLKECLGGGNPKKESGGKNFFNDYLEWLFYDNLNRKRENDYSDYFEYRIPYLNGGLFEPINSYDWKGVSNILLAWDDNNAIFRDIFETFDEYNFTVYENDPLEQDVAVDPEMLGKVFENLLPENERKWKWAFYTPREIVHYMCKESLKNHLMNKTGISEEKINKMFEIKDSMLNLKAYWRWLTESERYSHYGENIDYAEKIVSALKTIKIVDPAVWSGAFPMWLLKEIVSLRKYLQESILLEENVSEYAIKKETLENCIYWVDIDPWAVEIAKLRFWLSLVIEEDSKESIDPLPNLDYKIIQWNSLVEDIVVWEAVIKLNIEEAFKKISKKDETRQERLFWMVDQLKLDVTWWEEKITELLKELKYYHSAFFREKDNQRKKDWKIKIDSIEKWLIRESAEWEKRKIISKKTQIESKYLTSGMDINTLDQNEISKLEGQIEDINIMEVKYERDNIRTFFPWKLHFAEVFNENGWFDIVLGNPPYVQIQKFRWQPIQKALESQNYKTFEKTWDLYCLFYEKWLSLTKENTGLLCYITSNKWMRAGYGESIRKYFLTHSPISLVDLGGWVFETATVDTNILLISRKLGGTNFNAITIKGSIIRNEDFAKYINKNSISLWIADMDKTGKQGWFIGNQWEITLKKKIEIIGIPLKDWDIKINYWIKTGLNEAFMIDEKTKDGLINEDPKNERIIKPILRWRDMDRFEYRFANMYMICTFPALKLDIEEYPVIKNFLLSKFDMKQLDQSGKKYPELWFNARKETGNKWFETQDQIGYHKEFEKEKVVWGNISYDSCFAYGYIGDYVSAPANIITSNTVSIKYLVACMNSSIFNWEFKQSGIFLGSAYEWKKQYVEQIHIPKIIPENSDIVKRMEYLVDCILEIKRLNKDADTKKLEKEIDILVYQLYQLTPDEIELIEGSMKK